MTQPMSPDTNQPPEIINTSKVLWRDQQLQSYKDDDAAGETREQRVQTPTEGPQIWKKVVIPIKIRYLHIFSLM